MSPISPPSLCTNRCGTLVFGGGMCPPCRAEAKAENEARRGTRTSRGYDTRWAAFAKKFLRFHPQCECDECVALPSWKRPDATQVDHRDGKGPNGPRGFDYANLCAMSASHHSRKTASRDGGFGNPKRADQ